jgi:tripartite-type tricarboxylate transporter receptor subunit TctC
MPVTRRVLISILCSALPWLAATAHAQGTAADYPNRPVRLILPNTAAGLIDAFARVLAQQLAPRLGQPVVVDNRPGANMAIAAEATVKSPPDGHTLFVGGSAGLVLGTIARKTLPYDPVRDLAPISTLLTIPFYLVVRPSLPAHSVQELVALAKAQPGKLTYASFGTGSSQHLAAEILKSKMNIDLLHVPYKGSSESITAVVSGEVDMMFNGGQVLPLVKSGKLRALASTEPERTPVTPDLPTMIESGIPDYDVTSWFGLFGPAALPRPIIDRLNREVGAILRTSSVREKFAFSGMGMTPSTPEELGARLRADLPIWTKIMRDAGIQPE